MDEVVRDRIEAARREVSRSKLEPELKDALQMRLDCAHTCSNGCPDKLVAIAAAVSDGIVHDVRNEVRSRERMEAAIAMAVKAHADACPLNRGTPKTVKELALSMSQQYPTALLLAILWAIQRFGLEPVMEMLKKLCEG